MKGIQLLLVSGSCLVAQSAATQTWIQTSAPVTNCLSIACSADGSKVIAYGVIGGVWISSDSGNTWNPTPAYSWDRPPLAVSADGTSLAVFANLAASLGSGPVFVSTNAGLTWTTNGASAGTPSWVAAFFSADGSQLTALTAKGTRFTTTNGGATWFSNSLPLDAISAAAASADGSILVASSSSSISPNLCISTNAGGNWTTNNSLGRPANAISPSADGTRWVAGTAKGIYLSTNSGLAWTVTGAPTTNWISVASSADGARLVAASVPPNSVYPIPGPICSSTNYGLTWISNNVPPQLWSAVASSADGSKRFAVADNGGIWTCQTAPAPVLKITPTNGVQLAWLVPSTNLVLQQSPDLSATNWSAVTDLPGLDLSSLQYEVSLPPANNRRFFRLTTP